MRRIDDPPKPCAARNFLESAFAAPVISDQHIDQDYQKQGSQLFGDDLQNPNHGIGPLSGSPTLPPNKQKSQIDCPKKGIVTIPY